MNNITLLLKKKKQQTPLNGAKIKIESNMKSSKRTKKQI